MVASFGAASLADRGFFGAIEALTTESPTDFHRWPRPRGLEIKHPSVAPKKSLGL